LTLGALIIAVTASLANCEEVRLDPQTFFYSENFTLTREQLRDQKGEPYLGLTEAEMYLNPGECSMQVGYRNVTVYLATEVLDGGCMQNEVYRHEQEHVAIYHASFSLLPAVVPQAGLHYVLRGFFLRTQHAQNHLDNVLSAHVPALCGGAFRQFRDPPKFGAK